MRTKFSLDRVRDYARSIASSAISCIFISACAVTATAMAAPTVSPGITTGSHRGSCSVGAYRSAEGNIAALIDSNHVGKLADSYVLLNGDFSRMDAHLSALICIDGVVSGTSDEVGRGAWTKIPLREVPLRFKSGNVQLYGLLVEPSNASRQTPLVIFAQGSEKWSHVQGAYQYLMAAQGVSFVAWDKRGTNRSDGQFTDNFELLAQDMVAAARAAQKAASGRFGRVGFLGGSQGGWVAPLASFDFHPDFLLVAFGVAGSPIEQDQWQVRQQLASSGVPSSFGSDIDALTAATAKNIRSDFTQGASELETILDRLRPLGWLQKVDGQFSGQVIRGEKTAIRNENPGLMWDYDALAKLRAITIPQLWIMAGDDTEAPSSVSINRLQVLQQQCHHIEIFDFPRAEHGIHTYTESVAGQHDFSMGYADGYMKLLADYAKGQLASDYGDGYFANHISSHACADAGLDGAESAR